MTFKLMRSIAPDRKKFPLTYPKLISRKLDGIRGAKRGNKSTTKSGKVVPNHFNRKRLETFVPEGFDLEMIAGNPADPEVYSRTYSAVMTHEGETPVDFYVFDMHNRPDLNKLERLQLIAAILDEPEGKALRTAHGVNIIIVQQDWAHNDEDLDRLYNQYLDEGYEGAIAADPIGYYKEGKCTAKEQIQLKLKPEEDFEVQITGCYEAMHNTNEAFKNEVGETERSTAKEGLVGNGMLGGFTGIIVATGEPTKIAAGKLTHDQRRAAWLARETLPGKFCKARAMTYGVMANGALRHGRWYAWRDPVDMEPEGERA